MLVESVKAIASRAVGTPVGGNGVNDDQVAVHAGPTRAAIGESQTRKLLHQGTLPENFAILIETKQETWASLKVNVTRFGIYAGRPNSISIVNDVADKIAVATFPMHLTSSCIHADKSLLQITCHAVVAELVDASSRRNRNASTLNLMRPNQ